MSFGPWLVRVEWSREWSTALTVAMPSKRNAKPAIQSSKSASASAALAEPLFSSRGISSQTAHPFRPRSSGRRRFSSDWFSPLTKKKIQMRSLGSGHWGQISLFFINSTTWFTPYRTWGCCFRLHQIVQAEPRADSSARRNFAVPPPIRCQMLRPASHSGLPGRGGAWNSPLPALWLRSQTEV